MCRVNRKKVSLFIGFIVFSLCLVRVSRAQDENVSKFSENDIINVETGRLIDSENLYKQAHDSRVVYVGETHDNFSVHKVQLEIVKNLYNLSPGKIAIGMEMFQKRSQEKLDLWITGEISEKEFLKDVWYPDWGYEYEYYRGVIEFAKENQIKLVALNADETFVKRINEVGIDKLTKKEKKKLPDINLKDEYHRKRVKAVFDVHGKSMGDFEKFYTIQCLWDETMAESAADYLKSKEGKGKQLVVLAGKDHVRYGLGIPKRVYRRFKKPYTIILPVELRIPPSKKHNIMNVETIEVPGNEADFVWMVEYTDPVIEKVRLGIMVINSAEGVVAHTVEEGSPADRIGIKSGDVILDVDEMPILDPFDLVYEIRSKKPGKSGKVKVSREGKEIVFDITYELGNVME